MCEWGGADLAMLHTGQVDLVGVWGGTIHCLSSSSCIFLCIKWPSERHRGAAFQKSKCVDGACEIPIKKLVHVGQELVKM